MRRPAEKQIQADEASARFGAYKVQDGTMSTAAQIKELQDQSTAAKCGSGEYLHNEDGNQNDYCGQCGQKLEWGEEKDR